MRISEQKFQENFPYPSKEDIIPEIGKLKPDVVIIDFNLYDQIGGSETLNFIRDQFELSAWFE